MAKCPKCNSEVKTSEPEPFSRPVNDGDHEMVIMAKRRRGVCSNSGCDYKGPWIIFDQKTIVV
jgi:rRNA maturation protein Nop10